MNSIQIWSTGVVIALCAVAVLIVGPYAVRELVSDWRRLRGQFALGFSVLSMGVAARLTSAWVFYYTPLSERVEMLATLHPWILAANVLIGLGAVMCIRLVTARFGEWTWIVAVAGSALLAWMAMG